MPMLAGFAAVEAELMMRVGSSIPPDTEPTSIADYIDDVRFGLEIASSPFPGINAHGPAVTISDFGNNFGLLLGPPITDWRTRDLLGAPVVLAIDDVVVGTGTAAAMLDGPFGAVAFLARLLAARNIPVPAGTWVSTGAITGIHPISVGQSVNARFDNEYEVACRMVMFVPAPENDGRA
jgi:2-keto-4-pentenoate hydratase